MHKITTAFAGLLLAVSLSSCGGGAEKSGSESVSTSEKAASDIAASLDKKTPLNIVETLKAESESLTSLLAGVTDAQTAEASLPEIRAAIPRLNALAEKMQTMSPEDISLNLKFIEAMRDMGQQQALLIGEMSRVAQNSEAAAVLRPELEALDF